MCVETADTTVPSLTQSAQSSPMKKGTLRISVDPAVKEQKRKSLAFRKTREEEGKNDG